MVAWTHQMVLSLHQQIWVLKLATNKALYNKSSLAFWELKSTWFAILRFNIQSLDWIHSGAENFFDFWSCNCCKFQNWYLYYLISLQKIVFIVICMCTTNDLTLMENDGRAWAPQIQTSSQTSQQWDNAFVNTNVFSF